MSKRLGFAAALLAAAVLAVVASAQTVPAGPPPEGGTEIGNFGSLPFRAQQTLILRADERQSLRQLEDKQLKELRELEDRYEAELRTLRVRQSEERDALIRTFVR